MFTISFSFILYSLLFFILFLFLGLGLTILICPKKWRKYTIFLSPVIGFCLLTLAGWYFYSANFKGTDGYYIWILLIAGVLLVAAGIKVWKQKILKELFSKELIVPIVLAAIIFIIVAIPSLKQKQMTSLSIGNNDIASYALVSKIIQTVPQSDFHTINYFNADLTDDELGGYINTPFFCSVVKLAPYQVQMINIYVFFIFSLLVTYVLAREVFMYTPFAANVIVLLCGLSTLLYDVIYQGFERQIIAVPLMLLIMLSNVAVVRADKFKDALPYAPFLILSLWGLQLTYGHMTVIIYALLVPYVLLTCWKDRKAAKLLRWAAFSCMVFLIVFCLYPPRFQVLIDNIIFNAISNNGWFVPWITPQKISGISSFFIPDAMNIKTLSITIIVLIAALTVIVFGYIKLFKRDKYTFLFSSTTLFFIYLGALIMALLNVNRIINGGFGGYDQFKLISYFLPVIFLSSLVLFRDIEFSISNITRKRLLSFLIVAVLLVGNCVSARSALSAVVNNNLAVPPDTIGLEAIEKNKEITSINIPADNGAFWNIMWEAYFLAPRTLYFEQSSYYPASPLDGDWWLKRNNTGEQIYNNVLSISTQVDPKDVIPINATYSITNKAAAFTAKWGTGWSNYGPDRGWSITQNSTIILTSYYENTVINLTLTYMTFISDNSLSVYLNGSKIQDATNTLAVIKSTSVINNVLLKKGKNILEFKAGLPPSSLGNGDTRLLEYYFTKLELEDVRH